MSRLNLTQMVKKTLVRHQENKFFNVTEIYPDTYFESQKYDAKIKEARDRLNLDEKMKNIMLNVHEQIFQMRQSSPRPARVKPKSTKNKLKKKLKETPLSDKAIDNTTCENISIPRIKVLCSDKHKERFHKATETSLKCLSFESHKRMLLAQQRKNELESMIKEHKLLIEGRQSLEQDVFAMRHFLHDLQNRLNSSLQQLHSKKTFCECHGLLSNKNCKSCKKGN